MSDATSQAASPSPTSPSRGDTGSAGAEATPVAPDLDVIEADLADVEIALDRLDTGEYWRDEVTGADLDDAVLEQRPTARRTPA